MATFRVTVRVEEVDDQGFVQDVIGDWALDAATFVTPGDALTHGQRVRAAAERLRTLKGARLVGGAR